MTRISVRSIRSLRFHSGVRHGSEFRELCPVIFTSGTETTRFLFFKDHPVVIILKYANQNILKWETYAQAPGNDRPPGGIS